MATQDHIHLDTTIGSAPENAPVMTWKVTKRIPQEVVFLNVDYTRQGYMRPTVLKTAGTPVRLTNFRYTVKIMGTDETDTETQRQALVAMLGKEVSLVDSVHCADGAGHDSYIRPMFFSEVGEFKADHIKLFFYYVDITLLDASRT